MLCENQFRRYCLYEHKLARRAESYLRETRESEPSRVVGERAKNSVCSWVVSKKMGRSISTESKTAERAFVTLSEYDPTVFEYWDQPPPIKVRRVDKNGVIRIGTHTPDFVILSRSGPQVIEVKPLDIIRSLIDRQPENWIRTTDNDYQYLPAQNAFRDIGLEHSVFAYSDQMRFRVANYDLLLQARAAPDFDPSLPERLAVVLEEAFCWTLLELRQRLAVSSYTPLLQLIDQQLIVMDLERDSLAKPEACYVASTEELLKQGQELRRKNQIFRDASSRSIGMERVPRESDAKAALNKLSRLSLEDAPVRTLRRWRQLIDAGYESGLSAFQSLLPKHYRQGNRSSKISGSCDSFLREFLTTTFANTQGLSKYRGYAMYVESALSSDVPVEYVSRTTFAQRLKELPLGIIEGGRQGKRGERSAAAAVDPLKRGLKPALPWQVCAIDHYKADVFLVCHSDKDRVFVARPWISGMIDIATGKVVALTVSLRDPSKIVCAKIIRECVRQHQRLPTEIIVDRGSDFQSVFFSSLLAHYGITLSFRPAAHPRFGGEIEGLFGEFKKQWLTQRPGNLADYKEARAVDGAKAPPKSAILRPYDLYRELQAYAAWRDARPRSVGLNSSCEMFESGQDDFPFLGLKIEDDPEFRLATAVETKSYTVDFRRGIHIGDLWYFSPLIGDVKGKKSKLEVRCDPENPHLIHALINECWEPCFSSHINAFSAFDAASQFEQGLVAIDGHNYRRQIKETCDVELARLINEMDIIRNEGKVPLVPIAEAVVEDTQDQLVSKLDLANIRAISVGAW